jgi:hypothetical protein
MSYCKLITFKNGKQDDGLGLECKNAWGGAAYIWDSLWERYARDPRKMYDSWLMAAGRPGPEGKRLWDLWKRQDLPMCMRAVHLATFDYAIVKRENLQRFAADLREFVKAFPVGERVVHLPAWADFIEQHPEIEAIGFHVSENLWDGPQDDEGECKNPYDMATGDKHFDVYDEIEAFDQEQEAMQEQENVHP